MTYHNIRRKPAQGFAANNGSRRVSITLPDAEFAALAALARKNQRPIAWAVRLAVKRFLQEEKKE